MFGVRGKEEVRKTIETVSEEAEAMGSVEMVSVGVEEVKGVGVMSFEMVSEAEATKSVKMVSAGVKEVKEVGVNQSGAREGKMVSMVGVRGKDEAEAKKSVKMVNVGVKEVGVNQSGAREGVMVSMVEVRGKKSVEVVSGGVRKEDEEGNQEDLGGIMVELVRGWGGENMILMLI